MTKHQVTNIDDVSINEVYGVIDLVVNPGVVVNHNQGKQLTLVNQTSPISNQKRLGNHSFNESFSLGSHIMIASQQKRLSMDFVDDQKCPVSYEDLSLNSRSTMVNVLETRVVVYDGGIGKYHQSLQ